jgi:hypothetical protein
MGLKGEQSSPLLPDQAAADGFAWAGLVFGAVAAAAFILRAVLISRWEPLTCASDQTYALDKLLAAGLTTAFLAIVSDAGALIGRSRYKAVAVSGMMLGVGLLAIAIVQGATSGWYRCAVMSP